MNNTAIKPSLDALAIELAEWQAETFPLRTSASIAEHLRREANELVADPTDAEEMADIAMLVFGAAAHAGVDLAAAIAAKLAKNRLRTWGEPDAHGVVEHVETPSDAELIEFGRGLARAYVRNREVYPPIPRGAFFENELVACGTYVTITNVSKGGDDYVSGGDWIGLNEDQRAILLEVWTKRAEYDEKTGRG